jgi:hypothetical protein
MADEDDSNMIGSSFSLVRYNNPVLIDKHTETPSPTPTPGKGGKPGKGGDETSSGQPSKTRPKSAGETSEASTAAKQVRGSSNDTSQIKTGVSNTLDV